MDENQAVEEDSAAVATPIFSVYRRGYDPEQVDRYVTDQQRRLDEMTHRASESERKLAAAVGQLRELHRRVAVYESEARTAQPPALDSLGERVQRILQEAWEGAYNLRQEAERDVTEMRENTQREMQAEREQADRDVEELRQVASREAAELVDEATRRALALRDEMDRRREAYLDRVERDRQRAVSQITYLYDQKQLAIAELARLQTTVQATIEEMVRSPLGKPAAAIADAAAQRGPAPFVADDDPIEPAEDEAAVAELGTVGEETLIESTDAAAGDDGSDEMSAQPADEHAADEVMVASYRTPSHAGSLFSQIIDDPDAEMPPEELVPEAPLPVDRLVGTASGGTDTGTDLTLPNSSPYGSSRSRQEEMPTGPMDALSYGYGRYEHGSAFVEDDPAAAPGPGEDEAEADQVTDAETTTASGDGARHYGGVYDAEADGWA
jgi:hypothetical protein